MRHFPSHAGSGQNFASALAFTVAVLAAGPARAAGECDCDFVIELDVTTPNGAQLGVGPGDSVCVRGGARTALRLFDFVGSETEWIEIRNCEGVVEIDNEDLGYGLTMDGSRYVRITGAGDPAHSYGFRIRAARTGPDYSASGVSVGGLSSDYELDHFEVYETGFAGFNLKTEPRCDGSANLGNFVQYDTRVHHHWIHDTGGEGIYFGSTGYGGREYQCDGQTVLLYPHEHHGAQIHDNLIENTGWDGMQVGVTPIDCQVWGNVIRDVGLAGELYQQQGMQIGGASSCEIWANRLERGPTNGIFVLGAHDTLVHDNLVIDFGDSGIYANSNTLPELDGASYVFVHNTVLRSGGWGLALFGPNLAGNVGWNNLVLASGEADIAPGGDVDWDGQNNLTGLAIDAAGFVDPTAGDYHLRADSVTVGAGRAASEYSSEDLDAVPRDVAAPDVGAYEYTTEPPPGDGDGDGDPGDGDGDPGDGDGDPGDGDGDGGPDTTGDDTGSESGDTGDDAAADEASGCACASTDARPTALALLLLPLLAGLAGPRRRNRARDV